MMSSKLRNIEVKSSEARKKKGFSSWNKKIFAIWTSGDRRRQCWRGTSLRKNDMVISRSGSWRDLFGAKKNADHKDEVIARFMLLSDSTDQRSDYGQVDKTFLLIYIGVAFRVTKESLEYCSRNVSEFLPLITERQKARSGEAKR